ncbi:hypothetical protein V5799_026589 [Amblyomma americanum]|uniref:GIY-YIG domain-containing protein n=1 Tax=Amblyomma americanum TaxID=6943 RepID=A0AAQ4DI52_AMBAM
MTRSRLAHRVLQLGHGKVGERAELVSLSAVLQRSRSAVVHPTCHKRSVVSTLVRRAERICSKPEEKASDIRQVRRELNNCGYPQHFVNAVIQQTTRPAQPVRLPCRARAAIPYVPGVSESLARIFRTYDVHIAHVPACKLRHELVSVKDKLKKEKFPGVIYKIPCSDCDHSYIGESGNFERRLNEHKNDVKKKKACSNALAEHVENTKHDIAWEEAAIIGREKNWMSRQYLESLFIQTTDQTLNRNIGNLPPSYARCLRRLAQRT